MGYRPELSVLDAIPEIDLDLVAPRVVVPEPRARGQHPIWQRFNAHFARRAGALPPAVDDNAREAAAAPYIGGRGQHLGRLFDADGELLAPGAGPRGRGAALMDAVRRGVAEGVRPVVARFERTGNVEARIRAFMRFNGRQ